MFKKALFSLFLVIGILNVASAQITGTVFRDYNGNGVMDASESFVTGVIVKAYDASGAQCGTTTTSGATSPNYSLAGCSGDVRIEFEIPDLGVCGVNPAIDYTSSGGANYGSSVQFGTGTSTNINFAINAPEDYFTSSDNPVLYVPCYLNGDPANANVAAGDAFVNVNYDATGGITKMATAGDIGSTWGVAYSKQAKKVFTSAFLKRHVGLGPLGSGGIYMIDPTTNAVTNFINLDAIGVATQGTGAYAGSGPSAASLVPFTDVIGTNAERNLGNGLDQASYDAPALAQVGKVSLGDLDISDDGRYLFVVNLYDRKVYRIDLQNPENPVTPTAANVSSWTIPAPTVGCTNGEIRPFALEYARGSLFVGIVCSAENGGTAADLKGYVYQVPDFAAGTHTTLFDIDLDYDKGYAFSYFGNIANAEATQGWFPWTDDYDLFTVSGFNVRPQPVLSDIVFDADGSLILGFTDRTGHQAGWFNYGPNSTTLRPTVIGGDILRAYYNPNTCLYELENNGTAGPLTTAGANNSEGPGGGEFYYRDCFNCNADGYHREIMQGGLAMALGSGEVAAAVIDPSQYDSGGLTWFSNTTGLDTKDYELYFTGNNGNVPASGTFSKANGLGDLEVSGSVAPIEIGNRVWEDSDNDGVQDAGEPAIEGVEVQLCLASAPTTPIATATTDANGNYYFSSATGTNAASAIYGLNLEFDTDYILKFPTSSGTLNLTTANAGSSDLIDSDAGSSGQIAFKTGLSGQNNHSFDVGYSPTPVTPCPLPNCGTVTVIKN